MIRCFRSFDMSNRSAIINWILFAVIAISIILLIRWQAIAGEMFINETSALILLCLGFAFKIYKVRAATYIIFLILVVLLFQPITYSYTVSEGNASITHSSSRFDTLISPIVLLVLVCHIMFNYASMIDLYHLLVRGSEKEQREKREKVVDFYYNKFSTCSNIELEDIFKSYNEYPAEAQEALSRLKSEKGIS